MAGYKKSIAGFSHIIPGKKRDHGRVHTDTVCIIRMHTSYGTRHTEMARYRQIIVGYMNMMAEYGKMSAGNSRTLYRVLAGNSQIEAGYRRI